MSDENIVWEVIDGIAILKIDSPPQNFLLRPDFVDPELLKERLADECIRGMIVCGNGRHFSAGASPEELFQEAVDETTLFRSMESGKRVLEIIEFAPVPVIAAISGVCFGGGLEIALACHFRISSKNALFAFPETNLGLMPGLGGTYRIRGKLSTAMSLFMLLSGDIINAEKALAEGLIDQIATGTRPLDHAKVFIDKLTLGKQNDVIRSVMEAIHNGRWLDRKAALEEETRLFCRLAYREAKRRENEQ